MRTSPISERRRLPWKSLAASSKMSPMSLDGVLSWTFGENIGYFMQTLIVSGGHGLDAKVQTILMYSFYRMR